MAAGNDVRVDAAVAQSFNQNRRHFYLKEEPELVLMGFFAVEEMFLTSDWLWKEEALSCCSVAQLTVRQKSDWFD